MLIYQKAQNYEMEIERLNKELYEAKEALRKGCPVCREREEGIDHTLLMEEEDQAQEDLLSFRSGNFLKGKS